MSDLAKLIEYQKKKVKFNEIEELREKIRSDFHEKNRILQLEFESKFDPTIDEHNNLYREIQQLEKEIVKLKF